MAVTPTLQTLLDGPRNVVVKIHLVGDGTDAASAALINAQAYSNPTPGAGASLKIMKIWFSLAAFDVELEWDASSNVDIITLGGGTTDTLDFSPFGGLINNAGSGITGDIDFTTQGNAAGEDGTIILHMKKRDI